MPNVIVYGRKFALILLLASCKSGPTQTAPPDDTGPAPGTCATDDSKDTSTAIAWTAPVQGQICPRADVDFYAFTIPAGNDLVDVSAGFGNVNTRIDVSVQLHGSGDSGRGGAVNDHVVRVFAAGGVAWGCQRAQTRRRHGGQHRPSGHGPFDQRVATLTKRTASANTCPVLRGPCANSST